MDSNDVIRILRPPKIEVELFGEVHEMRRLSYGDLLELASMLAGIAEKIPNNKELDSPAVLVGLLTNDLVRPAINLILTRSFPTCSEPWAELDLDTLSDLLVLIYEKNQLGKQFKNFTQRLAAMRESTLAPRPNLNTNANPSSSSSPETLTTLN